jgi:hypothetical protein
LINGLARLVRSRARRWAGLACGRQEPIGLGLDWVRVSEREAVRPYIDHVHAIGSDRWSNKSTASTTPDRPTDMDRPDRLASMASLSFGRAYPQHLGNRQSTAMTLRQLWNLTRTALGRPALAGCADCSRVTCYFIARCKAESSGYLVQGLPACLEEVQRRPKAPGRKPRPNRQPTNGLDQQTK